MKNKKYIQTDRIWIMKGYSQSLKMVIFRFEVTLYTCPFLCWCISTLKDALPTLLPILPNGTLAIYVVTVFFKYHAHDEAGPTQAY